MDQNRFDALTRFVSGIPSRRHLLRGLAAAGLGLGTARLPGVAEAKKKRKRKKKEKNAKPNAFGCLEVGDPCKSEEDCCSGICEGKKGKQRCRAHDTGTCNQAKPGVCTAPTNDLPALSCPIDCFCFRTTAGSNYCSKGVVTGNQQNCTDCQKDADCLALGFPPGSACAPVGQGNCNGFCDSGMACLVPCGVELPEPVD